MGTDNKTIIYLDQNFISDIAKLSLEDKKDKVKPALQNVFRAIKNGVDEEKFLSPDSWVHAIETAAESNPGLKDAIQSYQAYLGQTSLNPPWKLKIVSLFLPCSNISRLSKMSETNGVLHLGKTQIVDWKTSKLTLGFLILDWGV